MRIQANYEQIEEYTESDVCQINRDGTCEKKEKLIIREHLMDVYINEVLVMKLVCTPSNLTELVLGRMLSEGMIKDISDVAYIYICEYGNRAKVMLNRQQKEKSQSLYVDTTPTCCTGNRRLNDYFVEFHELYPVETGSWKPEWVWKFMDMFDQDTPLHSKTGSAHSCFLMSDGEIVFQCEDIGRHNALDKAIGYALNQGIDRKHCAVYTSGRIPTDMVIKVIRAGIPVMVSKGMPTQEAVELAKKYQLTLIGRAKKGRMILYAGGMESWND